MGAKSATVIGVGILVVMLSACAPPAPLVDELRSDATPSAVPSVVREPSAEPAAAAKPCDEATPSLPLRDLNSSEQVAGMTLAVPFDLGPVETARGEAVTDDAGVPVAYRVASGDALSTVAARFCLSEDWLLLINYVRREGGNLYPGDTLNLDPHTMFTVGDQNGEVFDRALPDGFVVPPQR